MRLSRMACSHRVTDLETSAPVALVAAELGVNRRTAFRRLALADQLAGHPDLAAKVDVGEIEATPPMNRKAPFVASRM